jgi:hypothetical protein
VKQAVRKKTEKVCDRERDRGGEREEKGKLNGTED